MGAMRPARVLHTVWQENHQQLHSRTRNRAVSHIPCHIPLAAARVLEPATYVRMPLVTKRACDDALPDAKKVQKANTVRVNVGGRLFETTVGGQ